MPAQTNSKELLTQAEVDVVGEVANISFGSASTVLSTLLNKTVSITAPRVEVVALQQEHMEAPYVVLDIQFTKGLSMQNLLVLKQEVALAIADLMMMGTGEIEPGRELTDLELSAVQEAMNQMMGFAATSMSQFFGDTVDMTPPGIKVVDLWQEIHSVYDLREGESVVQVSFDLQIGDFISSKLVQVVSVEGVKTMARKLLGEAEPEMQTSVPEPVQRLSREEKDILGEIANISIGSASTVLSTLLNQSVVISVPSVELINARQYMDVAMPYIVLNVNFIEGIKHENVFVIEKETALSMVDLMMMGTGEVDADRDLTELEVSGVKEIMNQMMGHAATAMSELFHEKVDITPPTVRVVALAEELEQMRTVARSDEVVQITFQLEIGDRIHSRMYQFLTIEEAQSMTRRLLPEEEPIPVAVPEPPQAEAFLLPDFGQTKPAAEEPAAQAGNQNDLMLQQVEINLEFVFGSTVRTIENILSLQESEVVVLDEDIDEPIQIYANGVLIAYGELVNVDGFFGIKVAKAL
ncbi:flagellar motor switch phosphatase FliY [Ectobacillus sp. SYSU M60031]|uniref:Flagellar motor switch phosphatase FliY n=1 Tax=Ectobacillus ponti TaxID=2961894 RepID=A0AA42BQU6_9BACI|nr:chemotaxis protein CheC [Ectobacillus ponti]MCP8968829.1 flagellar motor switch phosphatase FliY [Ectobacillus ponti]